MKLKLTARQAYAIKSLFEGLVDRLGTLREKHGPKFVPTVSHIEDLFTDLDDYPHADEDEEVNLYLNTLLGVSIGLGLDGTLDLYQSYRAGVEIVEHAGHDAASK